MGKRLLVIDDQEGVAKAVGRIARELGYDAKTLTSPDRALDVYIDYKPDVVMVDVIMPEKDGIDVLNEIMLTSHRARVGTDQWTQQRLPAAGRTSGKISRLHGYFRVAQAVPEERSNGRAAGDRIATFATQCRASWYGTRTVPDLKLSGYSMASVLGFLNCARSCPCTPRNWTSSTRG